MNITLNKVIKFTIFVLLILIITGAALFIYNAKHDYNINSGFTSIPLNYDPEDNASSYDFKDLNIVVYNGFVKGIQKEDSNEVLVIRALSPLPSLEFQNATSTTKTITIYLENINPNYYSSSINISPLPLKVTDNTLEFVLTINPSDTLNINPAPPSITDASNYIVLGDSRDGYDTFQEIIKKINNSNPIFVIDNGDLVFSGKPNQYRIFDNMVKGISTTFLTTLGNHDIRNDGRAIYTKLYGPAYYSFDFGTSHFIFLDSSRGFVEAQAIPDAQYEWLERDLIKAQGKTIYVISHIPSTDPREDVKANDIQSYIDQANQDGTSLEQIIEMYADNMDFAHGFRTTEEASRFEGLMSQYNVDTVYLSHIHSYYDYTINNVRYVISGGGGAEILSKDSYYHYLIVKANPSDTITIVNIPSPDTPVFVRLGAIISEFAIAMYIENTVAVVLYIISFALLVILLLIYLYIRFNKIIVPFLKALKEASIYFIKDYKNQKMNYDTKQSSSVDFKNKDIRISKEINNTHEDIEQE
jgi:3',5'-cyclic AMP phosphodiesterase CpdA